MVRPISRSSTRFFLYIALLFFVISIGALSGCEQSHQEVVNSKSIELRTVVGSETGQLFQRLAELFHQSNPTLSDGRGIHIQLIVEPSMPSVEHIASGKLKSEAWLAPSSAFVRVANATRRNLGANQGSCKQLFATPLVIAAISADREVFGTTVQKFSWSHFRSTRFAPEPSANAEAANVRSKKYVRFLQVAPDHSFEGLLALIEFAYLGRAETGNAGDSPLTSNELSDERLAALLREYQSMSIRYAQNETALFRPLSLHPSNEIRFAVATERSIVMTNLRRTPDLPPIVALYPNEGSVWADYTFCFSESDWVTPAHTVGLHRWLDFLSGDLAQREMFSAGFRPSVVSITEGEPLSARNGVDPALPERSFPSVGGEVITQLLSGWPKFRRPAATVFVLDSSASMDGTALNAGKEAVRMLIANESEQDQLALASFGSEPSVQWRFGEARQKMFDKLDSIQAIGGSAVYDGIRAGLDLFSDKTLQGHRKNLVVFTDGDDRNSTFSKDNIAELLDSRATQLGINLFLIAIAKEEVDHTPLRDIASRAGGEYEEPPLDQVTPLLERIRMQL